jgi:hypothetical protein
MLAALNIVRLASAKLIGPDHRILSVFICNKMANIETSQGSELGRFKTKT